MSRLLDPAPSAPSKAHSGADKAPGNSGRPAQLPHLPALCVVMPLPEAPASKVSHTPELQA